jgi:hypothetical protein
MNFRKIAPLDIPALFAVRVSTHENRLTLEELTALGITEESVKEKLSGSFHGWLCEADQRMVGFAMGDKSSGELWVIAVLPGYIGKKNRFHFATPRGELADRILLRPSMVDHRRGSIPESLCFLYSAWLGR